MALQKFRDKQKMIYWIVAIIVIPSFMIFGYSQVFDYNPENGTVGIIDEKPYTVQEFNDFFQRIQAVNFGQPVYLTMDGQAPWLQSTNAMFTVLALRDKARKNGIIITDDEVATYIKGQFGYEGNSEKELEELINNMLKETSHLKSVYDYKIGVRDWLLVKKFLNVLDNSIFFPSTFANISNTMQKTTVTYGKLDIPVQEFNKTATTEFDELSEAELKSRAEEFINEFQKPGYRTLYPFLWTSAKWKLEYISVPLVFEALEPDTSDKAVEDYYKANPDRYKDSDGKVEKFDDIKEKVKKDYIASYRVRTVQTTFGNEYDRFLHRMVLKGENSDKTIQKVELTDIDADSRLKARGVSTGSTGPELLTAYELADSPVFVGSGIQYFLANLDHQFQNAKQQDLAKKNNEAVQKIFDDYSRSFRGYEQFNTEIPFASSDKTLSKVRLIDYQEGKKRNLSDKDGSELLEEIKKAMIENTADKMAMDAAENAKIALKENKKEIDGREVTTDESNFASLYTNRKLAKLGLTPVGETFGPIINETATGYTVYIIYNKDTDSLEGQNNQKITSDTLSHYYRGNSEYQPEFPMTPVIKVGARLAAYLYAQDSNIKLITKN